MDVQTLKPIASQRLPCAPRRKALFGLGSVALLPLLKLAGCSTVGASNSHSLSALPGPNSAPSAEQAAAAYRFVNRLSWGARPVDVQRCLQIGQVAYLREQLQPAAVALPEAVQAQIDRLSIQQPTPAERYAAAEKPRKTSTEEVDLDKRKLEQEAYQREMTRQGQEVMTRAVLRALYSPAQLQEQMVWFWFNHFNVHLFKSQIRLLLADYEEQALRPHALGSFRAMLGAVARSPAMLLYLDNAQNGVGRINENYARELLELHTLGVEGGYTQKDVQELARVLTGHGVNFSANSPKLKPEWQALYQRDGFYEFNPARHDFGDKLLLGKIIRGRGAAELDEVLDLLAAHPATARFVSRKLAMALLMDEPPAELVEAMSRAFRADAVTTVLQVLASSPLFSAAQSSKFKDPVHYVLSALRSAYPDTLILDTAPVRLWLNTLGQGLYNRPTPDGYPLVASAWNSSGQLAARFDVARAIGGGAANLFKPADGPAPMAARVMPTLMGTVPSASGQGIQSLGLPANPMPALRPATIAALQAAKSTTDRNTLYLAAPEFMFR